MKSLLSLIVLLSHTHSPCAHTVVKHQLRRFRRALSPHENHFPAEIQTTKQAREACGVIVAAFGEVQSKYLKAAVANVFRIQEMLPGTGWCPMESGAALEHIPVTLITDVPKQVLLNHFGHRVKTVSVVSNTTFDRPSLDINGLSDEWWSEGPPIYRWYHCQSLVHAPYDLTLYLDADATICAADRFAKLFRKFSETNADMAFQVAQSPQGYFMGVPMGEPQGFYCTDGDARNPHPDEAKTADDMDSWQNTEEPNAGVILFAKHRATAQKVASEWCAVIEETMHNKDKAMPCDQYALRTAFWKHRHTFKAMTLADGGNGICRYARNTGSACNDGCAIVHGWKYTEVRSLLGKSGFPDIAKLTH